MLVICTNLMQTDACADSDVSDGSAGNEYTVNKREKTLEYMSSNSRVVTGTDFTPCNCADAPKSCET